MRSYFSKLFGYPASTPEERAPVNPPQASGHSRDCYIPICGEENLVLEGGDDNSVMGKPYYFTGKPAEYFQTGACIALATIASGFAADGFMRYAEGLLIPFVGEAVAEILGYACGVPIAFLSGLSGGKVLDDVVSELRDDPKKALEKRAMQLITLGAWNRQDLLSSAPENFREFGANKIILQTVNIAFGLINFWGSLLSIIASDAMNWERSHTWWSTGPNTLTSFSMNTYYLKKVLDQILDMLAARLEDTTTHRQNALAILAASKNILPSYMSGKQTAVTTGICHFSDIEKPNQAITDEVRTFFLVKNQQEKIQFLQGLTEGRISNGWSIVGLMMLLPAIVFTLPLVGAGEKAKMIFKGTGGFMELLVDHLPWYVISGSSFLCNLMINGVNSYDFGKRIGELFTAIYNREAKSYLSDLTWLDYFIKIPAAAFLSALAATAQAGAARDNALFPNIATLETILVAIASFAIYFRASNTALTRFINFLERISLNKKESFSDGDIPALLKFMVEKIEKMGEDIKRKPYREIESIMANNPAESIPSYCHLTCCFFSNGTRRDVNNSVNEEYDDVSLYSNPVHRPVV
jgi:hypothetical protein